MQLILEEISDLCMTMALHESKGGIVMPALSIPLGPLLPQNKRRESTIRGQEAVVFALLELAKMLAEKLAAVSANTLPVRDQRSGQP